ncbi:MAG: S8 family serine peptidase [Candidatus Dojkabacteria bacterium]
MLCSKSDLASAVLPGNAGVAENIDSMFQVLRVTPGSEDNVIELLAEQGITAHRNRIYTAQILPTRTQESSMEVSEQWQLAVLGLLGVEPSEWDLPKVAVIDTGGDGNHPDLRYQDLTVVPELTNMDGSPATGEDMHSHGTHVAGIIGALNNGAFVNGMNLNSPDAPPNLISIQGLNREGYGSSLEIAQAIQMAVEAGAKIINLSLGGSVDPILDEACREAAGAGVLLVIAGGNDGSDLPSSPGRIVRDTSHIIYVSAARNTDNTTGLTDFSSRWSLPVHPGSLVVVAPGEEDYLYSTSLYMSRRSGSTRALRG